MSCKGCLASSATLLVLLLLVCGIGVLTVGQFLTTIDTVSSADAIVVLSGDSEDFARTEQAAHLFHKGYAPMMVLSTSSSKYAGLPCSPAQQSLAVARSQGVSADAVILISDAESTYEEAVKLRRLAQQRDWHRLIIVTDLFHTRRASRTFRTLLPDVTIYVTAAPNPEYDPRRWWRTEDGLVLVFSEVIKLAFYWVKYGIAPIGI